MTGVGGRPQGDPMGWPASMASSQLADHLAGQIQAGGGLDPLESRAGVDLQQQGAAAGAQDVDAGHIEAQGLAGLDGHLLLRPIQLHRPGRSPLVQVGPEFALGGPAFDRGHHLAADHEAAQIRAAGLLDELLHQQVGIEALEGIDDALGRLLGFGQHDPLALDPLQQLHDQGGAPHHADQIDGVERGIGEARDGRVESGADDFLGGEELVAGGGDRLSTVEGGHPHRLELADVEEPHLMAPFLAGLDQAAANAEIGMADQQHDPQAGLPLADVGMEGPTLVGAVAAQVQAALRVHQDPSHHRLPGQQHPVAHGIPVGERQLHLPALLAEHQPLPDHMAAFRHRGLTADHHGPVALQGMDLEVRPGATVALERHDELAVNPGLAPLAIRGWQVSIARYEPVRFSAWPLGTRSGEAAAGGTTGSGQSSSTRRT